MMILTFTFISEYRNHLCSTSIVMFGESKSFAPSDKEIVRQCTQRKQ